MSENAHIILFRGVGGDTQLPVKRLREVLTEAGFANVKTYINSGNAVLSSEMNEGEVALAVAKAVREKMGFEKHVLVRGLADWENLIAENPFADAVSQPTTLHAYTLETQPTDEAIAQLSGKATGTERFVVKGRALYLHTPDGMGVSRFAPKMEPTLNIAMTARNWRTVLALAQLAQAIGV